MNFPHTITIYNYTKIGYLRTVLTGVLWVDTKGLNVNKTGSTCVDSLKVVIPCVVTSDGAVYKNPADYQASPAGAWALQTKVKDFIVKGICPFEPAGRQISELLTGYDALTVTDVKLCDYGSSGLHHWEVGAK